MNRKKITVIRSLKLLALLLPILLLISWMPYGDYDDPRRIQNYYREEPDSLDVVFMGASDIYAGWSPALAYEQFGFTSYPYVLSGNFSELFPMQLEAIFETQSPQLVVIDITEAVHDKGPDYDAVLQQHMAGLPFSRNKVRWVMEYGNPEHRLSYLIPFITFRGEMDWAVLKESWETDALLRRRGYSLLKGVITFTGTGANWDGDHVVPVSTEHDTNRAPLHARLEASFTAFLDYCQEGNYDNLLFVNYPHRNATEESLNAYHMANTMGDLIESYGYDFINLDSICEEIGIEPMTDFYNNDHMNLYGQFKTTRYLGSLLTERYGVSGRELSPESKARWDTSVRYNHLYYDCFDEAVKNRDPDEEFGTWMKEDAWFISELEARMSN